MASFHKTSTPFLFDRSSVLSIRAPTEDHPIYRFEHPEVNRAAWDDSYLGEIDDPYTAIELAYPYLDPTRAAQRVAELRRIREDDEIAESRHWVETFTEFQPTFTAFDDDLHTDDKDEVASITSATSTEPSKYIDEFEIVPETATLLPPLADDEKFEPVAPTLKRRTPERDEDEPLPIRSQVPVTRSRTARVIVSDDEDDDFIKPTRRQKISRTMSQSSSPVNSLVEGIPCYTSPHVDRAASSKSMPARKRVGDGNERDQIRKLKHNEVEQKRRIIMNDCIDELRTLVPACSRETSKADTLVHSVDFISVFLEEVRAMAALLHASKKK